jgi:hypothetical protein
MQVTAAEIALTFHSTHAATAKLDYAAANECLLVAET